MADREIFHMLWENYVNQTGHTRVILKTLRYSILRALALIDEKD
jgi:hypothetical protein